MGGRTAATSPCVNVKKCRYLEATGCAGVCVNMCKLPAQDVMASEFGVPVYMAPNFETGGCRMFFGQEPLPESVDQAILAVLGAVRRRGAILAETADGGGRDGSGRVPSGERVGRAGDAGAGVGQVWGVAGEGAAWPERSLR